MFNFFKKKKGEEQLPKEDDTEKGNQNIVVKGYTYQWKDEIKESERNTPNYQSRPFCVHMMGLAKTKLWSRERINEIGETMGYNLFDMVGGDGCRHEWKEVYFTDKGVDQDNIKLNARTQRTFSGIDYEFIDLLFFKDLSEKNEFIQTLIQVLKTLDINEDSLHEELYEKIYQYIKEKKIHQFIDEDEMYFPFLMDLFIFKTKIKIFIGDYILKETNLENDYSGIKKLDHYKDLNFATYNLEKKIAANYSNIEFEENLIMKLLNSEKMDFARIDSLFSLGHSFCQIGDFQKMGIYFKMIENDKYDLSPNTVADFIRLIGEDYNKIGDFKNAYHYLSIGLKLNPNLGVKKLLAKIEKLIN